MTTTKPAPAVPAPSAKPSHHAAIHKSFKPFQVEGDFQMGRVRQHFVIQVAAANEAGAKDRVFATLGSRHGVNRRQVFITATKGLQGDDVTDAIVRHELGLNAH